MFKILKAVVALATIQDMAEAINVRIKEHDCDEDCLSCLEEGNTRWIDGECVENRDLHYGFVQINSGNSFVQIKQRDTYGGEVVCDEWLSQSKSKCKTWCKATFTVNPNGARADCRSACNDCFN